MSEQVARITLRHRNEGFPRLRLQDVELLVNGVELPWTEFALAMGGKNGCAKCSISFYVNELDVDLPLLEMLVKPEPELHFSPDVKAE